MVEFIINIKYKLLNELLSTCKKINLSLKLLFPEVVKNKQIGVKRLGLIQRSSLMMVYWKNGLICARIKPLATNRLRQNKHTYPPSLRSKQNGGTPISVWAGWRLCGRGNYDAKKETVYGKSNEHLNSTIYKTLMLKIAHMLKSLLAFESMLTTQR